MSQLPPDVLLLSDLADALDEHDGDAGLEFVLPDEKRTVATAAHFLGRVTDEGPVLWVMGSDARGAHRMRTASALSAALDSLIEEWRELEQRILVRCGELEVALGDLEPRVTLVGKKLRVDWLRPELAEQQAESEVAQVMDAYLAQLRRHNQPTTIDSLHQALLELAAIGRLGDGRPSPGWDGGLVTLARAAGADAAELDIAALERTIAEAADFGPPALLRLPLAAASAKTHGATDRALFVATAGALWTGRGEELVDPAPGQLVALELLQQALGADEARWQEQARLAVSYLQQRTAAG